MNDRYLYRAKRCDTGEWVIGYYVSVLDMYKKEVHMIFEPTTIFTIFYSHVETDGYVEVDQSTICQCSGKHDKYYNRIFENDIVKVKGVLYVCRFDEDNFAWEFQNNEETIGICCFHSSDIEITGNAIDNPELLEVGE